jgi:hypothetical protein
MLKLLISPHIDVTYWYVIQCVTRCNFLWCVIMSISSGNVLFLLIIVQLGHNQRDTLKVFWSTLEQYFTAFYGNTMKLDRFYHVRRCLHLSDNNSEHDKEWKWWLAVENESYIWQAKWFICWITFSSWWNHCARQRYDHLQTVYTKERQAVFDKVLQPVWF